MAKISRKDLLKFAGVGGAALAGGALTRGLGLSSVANAQEVPHHAFAEGYLANADLGMTLLVQAVAPNVPVVAAGDPVASLASPGRGFDFDLAAAVVGNNKHKNKGGDPLGASSSSPTGRSTGIRP